jgi:dihydroorotase
MSTAPAMIGGYTDHGSIEVGKLANFILVDPSARWQVDRTQLLSRSSNTPFHGLSLPAVISDTFYRGVHVLKNGQLTGMKYE